MENLIDKPGCYIPRWKDDTSLISPFLFNFIPDFGSPRWGAFQPVRTWRGGVLTLKRVTVMSSIKLKTPFSRSLSRSTRPHFQHFSVPQDSILTRNSPIFCSKCLLKFNYIFSFPKPKNWPKNLVEEASFGPKISSASSIIVNISVSKPLNLALISSTS